MSLGKQMRKIRLNRDMTQSEVGELIGCHRHKVSNYETGACIPTIARLFRFIKTMNLSNKEILALVLAGLKSS